MILKNIDPIPVLVVIFVLGVAAMIGYRNSVKNDTYSDDEIIKELIVHKIEFTKKECFCRYYVTGTAKEDSYSKIIADCGKFQIGDTLTITKK